MQAVGEGACSRARRAAGKTRHAGCQEMRHAVKACRRWEKEACGEGMRVAEIRGIQQRHAGGGEEGMQAVGRKACRLWGGRHAAGACRRWENGACSKCTRPARKRGVQQRQAGHAAKGGQDFAPAFEQQASHLRHGHTGIAFGCTRLVDAGLVGRVKGHARERWVGRVKGHARERWVGRVEGHAGEGDSKGRACMRGIVSGWSPGRHARWVGGGPGRQGDKKRGMRNRVPAAVHATSGSGACRGCILYVACMEVHPGIGLPF
eukprot:364744-Chlamydomonas_euryale.AAC.8